MPIEGGWLLPVLLLLSARSLPLLGSTRRGPRRARVCVPPLRFALIRASSCLHKGTPAPSREKSAGATAFDPPHRLRFIRGRSVDRRGTRARLIIPETRTRRLRSTARSGSRSFTVRSGDPPKFAKAVLKFPVAGLYRRRFRGSPECSKNSRHR